MPTPKRILVYEHITALGIGRDPASVDHSLYREGRAMRDAVIADFERAGWDVVASMDWQGDGISRAVTQTEAQVVIAPEFDGILTDLTRQIEAAGGKVLGPTSEAVALTSDKLRLAEHWRERGIPTPATSDREPTVCEVFPIVWKPRDGAGSTATFRLDRGTDVARTRALREAEGHVGEMVMQEFVPGLAASVSFLTGPGEPIALPPALQRLTGDGRFKYQGGEVPLPGDLGLRAVTLARPAIAAVPGLRGWVGVDVVLGDAADGSRDYAIEINPRLTTSYVGLRCLCEENLASAMLRVAEGEAMALTWRARRIAFESGGNVQERRGGAG